MQLEPSVQKLNEETVQGEDTAVESLSLSCLQQLKECLERDQGRIERVQQDIVDFITNYATVFGLP